MTYVQRLPDEFVKMYLKGDSGQLEQSIRRRLKKVHSFLFSDSIPEYENREYIAYLAISGNVNWSDHYRGTSLEDVQFYDHFARQQVTEKQQRLAVLDELAKEAQELDIED